MKRLIVTAVGTVALLAGTAYAGGGGSGSGCTYGDHADSGAQDQSALLAAAEGTDPKLLAKLKVLEDTEALEKLIETPALHN